MLVEFRADLHIHTCLSPCAELSMTPRAIAEKAASCGLDVIALCDHNSAENVEVAQSLCRKKGIMALAGMEVTSAEEVHVLALFDSCEDALLMQTAVYEHLQPGVNDEDAFGMQVVVNADDEVMGFNNRLLIGSTDLSVNAVVDLIHARRGLAVASHIDRQGFGIIGQLGFIPPELAFDALEISSRMPIEQASRQFSVYSGIPWITSSDAHLIEDIGKRTTRFVMRHRTLDEMSLALQGIDGRKVAL
jgi:PHP family Zn ribbon phosphoesterase